jgi:hypothetical protein
VNVLKSCCSSVLSNKRAGERVPSIGRKIGCVQRIGHVKNYRFASKKPSARAVFGCARPRHAVSSAQPRSRTSVLALHQPSLCRRNGLVRRIGHIKISQIWSRNCRARPDSGRTRTSTAAVEKHVQGTLSRLRRILSAARAACPPANPPGARPPLCLPARPPEPRARARARIPAAGAHVLRGPLNGPRPAGFVYCLRARTSARPTGTRARFPAWACAPWRPTPPQPAGALRAPMLTRPRPVLRLGSARPAPPYPARASPAPCRAAQPPAPPPGRGGAGQSEAGRPAPGPGPSLAAHGPPARVAPATRALRASPSLAAHGPPAPRAPPYPARPVPAAPRHRPRRRPRPAAPAPARGSGRRVRRVRGGALGRGSVSRRGAGGRGDQILSIRGKITLRARGPATR